MEPIIFPLRLSISDGYSDIKIGRNSHTLDRDHGYGLSKIQYICEKYNGSFEQKRQDKKMISTAYLPL